MFLPIYNIEGTRSFYCRQSDLHHIVKSCVSRPADIGLAVHYSVMFLYNKASSVPTSWFFFASTYKPKFNKKLYGIKYKKISKKVKKTLAFFWEVVYTLNCCDIDSNEARGCCHRDGRFSVERMSSLKTDDKSLYKFRRPSRDGVCGKKSKDTHGDVYSRRLSYCLKSTNRRRLFLWQIR